MDSTARRRLAEFIRSEGIGLASNPQRVRAVLFDACPESRTEASLLVAAAEDEIPSRLARSSDSVFLEGEITRAIADLQQSRCLDGAAAAWTVRSWGWALGILAEEPPDTLPTGPDSGSPLDGRPASGGGLATPPVVAAPAQQGPWVGWSGSGGQPPGWSGSGGQPPPVPPARSRRGLLILLSALTATATIALVAVVIALWPPPPPPPPTATTPTTATSTTESPAAALTQAEQELVDTLPSQLVERGSCTSYAEGNSTAGVSCTAAPEQIGSNAPMIIQVLKFGSRASLNASFHDKTKEQLCPGDHSTWHFNSNPSEAVGSLSCYQTSQDRAVVAWTYWNRGLACYAIGRGSDVKNLYAWWKQASKPDA
jgi:hypothetical protein